MQAICQKAGSGSIPLSRESWPGAGQAGRAIGPCRHHLSSCAAIAKAPGCLTDADICV